MKIIQKLLSILAYWLDRGAFTHDLSDQRENFIQKIRGIK